jgi:phenylpropionate dioxygenase-like ring-hydroxylating dioxygenase large terminal subunit
VTTTRGVCEDPVILNEWHPIAAIEEITPGVVAQTTLLDCPLSYTVGPDGDPIAWPSVDSLPAGAAIDLSVAELPPGLDPVPVRSRYLYLWASLGSPDHELFEIPEFDEPDRRNIHAASVGVNVSAPRAVENFLDMGHFPYVHTDILGVEPHTEVAEYQVDIDPDTNEIWATQCVFYQPAAAATATTGQMSEYIYRVVHPYCVLLYKSCPVDEDRMDVIGLFCKSMRADHIEASMLLCLIDDTNSTTVLRRFQLAIFGQDKPILENQYPKCLPLDPRAETPIRADKVAIAYRRWLSDLGVTYGVIAAE